LMRDLKCPQLTLSATPLVLFKKAVAHNTLSREPSSR
jgi:hypothetical protein